tara:strand:+ start:1543 stop:2676 length:1134 start_codon:yes stop_codon:yes gene_type:complete
MSLNVVPKHFRFLQDCSINGVFIEDGFLSKLVYAGSFSTLFINLRCDVDYTLNIYKCPTANESEKTLFYSKTQTAGVTMARKFAIPQSFFSVEIVNTTSTEGLIFLNSSVSIATQFDCQTFLNSTLSIDDNTNLVRLANNYEVDLVRNIQSDFKKINIQGILRSNPASEVTIGLTSDYKYTASNVVASLVVAGANDNQPAGTGARHIRIQGVDDDGVEYNSIYDVNTGSGLMGVDFTGIHRMTITEVGSLGHNEGAITITGDAGAILGYMGATENVSHFSYYKVPANKQLIVRDIHIAAYSPSGKIIVYEFDPATNIQASIGEFLVTTSYQQLSYTLDGLITAGKVLKVNYVPTAVGGDILINVNVNAVLCPTISAF